MRKRDISSVVDAVASFTGNNPSARLSNQVSYKDGKADTSTSLGTYLDTLSTNTDEIQVTSNVAKPSTFVTSGSDQNRPNKIWVIIGAKCKDGNDVQKGSSRSVAVIGANETSNAPQAYCQDAN